MLSLVEGFTRYFDIRLAHTEALKEQSYRIRHQVYAEELAWEERQGTSMETDAYDPHALPLLLRHKASGLYAGTIRLVTAPSGSTSDLMPFEELYGGSIRKDVLDPDRLERNRLGEISRLCVPAGFRRRAGEKNKPFILNDMSGLNLVSEEDQRNFPKISVGLYLSVVAAARLRGISHLFIVAETRLKRRLEWLGIHMTQIADEKEHRGKRSLFFLQPEIAIPKLKPELSGLYHWIEAELQDQLF